MESSRVRPALLALAVGIVLGAVAAAWAATPAEEGAAAAADTADSDDAPRPAPPFRFEGAHAFIGGDATVTFEVAEALSGASARVWFEGATSLTTAQVRLLDPHGGVVLETRTTGNFQVSGGANNAQTRDGLDLPPGTYEVLFTGREPALRGHALVAAG